MKEEAQEIVAIPMTMQHHPGDEAVSLSAVFPGGYQHPLVTISVVRWPPSEECRAAMIALGSIVLCEYMTARGGEAVTALGVEDAGSAEDAITRAAMMNADAVGPPGGH